jgi:aminopeptidase YwaD
MNRRTALLVPILVLACAAPALAMPAPAPATGVRAAVDPLAFDGAAALAHTTALAAIGPRKEGAAGESKAVAYCVGALKGFGYTVTTMPFKLPNGSTSRNVVAVKAGTSARQVIFGAHIDSKPPSPGANDNGSGAGAVLELAHALSGTGTVEPTVVFVLFGAEEMSDSNPSHHHFGSRAYVARLTAARRANISALVSVDMIGYGPYFYARTMGIGPKALQSRLRTFASARSIYLRYLKDTSRYGSSDHEPFERAGIPSVWLEWRSDPTYHTARDTVAHLQVARIGVTGQMLLDWTRSLTAADLAALRR